jgi:predicted Zn-dependent protease
VEEAVQVAEKYLALTPTDKDVRGVKADLLLQLDRRPEAFQELETLIQEYLVLLR